MAPQAPSPSYTWGDLEFEPPTDVAFRRRLSEVTADGTALPGECAIGMDRLVMNFDAPGERRPATLLLVPSLHLELDDRVAGQAWPGLLRVAGAWPRSCVHLLFETREEALEVSDDLTIRVQRLILALHARAPLGAPLLALAPLNERPGPPYSTRGDFLLGGYVIATRGPGPEDTLVRPSYELLYAELWGPDNFGWVRMHFYSSHMPHCKYLLSSCWPKPPEEPATLEGFTVRLGPADEPHAGWRGSGETLGRLRVAFRSTREAVLWIEVAETAYKGKMAKERRREDRCRVVQKTEGHASTSRR